jgi:hypothetical protein
MSDMLKSYNPANGQLVGEVTITGVEQIADIVITAKQWRKVSVSTSSNKLTPLLIVVPECLWAEKITPKPMYCQRY